MKTRHLGSQQIHTHTELEGGRAPAIWLTEDSTDSCWYSTILGSKTTILIQKQLELNRKKVFCWIWIKNMNYLHYIPFLFFKSFSKLGPAILVKQASLANLNHAIMWHKKTREVMERVWNNYIQPFPQTSHIGLLWTQYVLHLLICNEMWLNSRQYTISLMDSRVLRECECDRTIQCALCSIVNCSFYYIEFEYYIFVEPVNIIHRTIHR